MLDRLWISFRIPLLLVTSTFLLCRVVQRGSIPSWDGQIMAGVGRSMVEHHNLYRYDQLMESDHIYTDYGIGVSLLSTPLWKLQLAMNPDGLEVVTLLNAVLVSVTSLALYAIARLLAWSERVSLCVGYAYVAFTMALQYSTEMFSEPGVALCTTTALLGLLVWRLRSDLLGSWVLGLSIATAMLFRADSVVLVGVSLIFIPLFVPWRSSLRGAIGLVVPVGASFGWLLYYNQLRYGEPFRFSLPNQPGFSFPVTEGLYRLVVSPGKGFFWYNPLLVAAAWGVILLMTRGSATIRSVGWYIVAMSLARLFFYSRWWMPDGSVAWGPRFLLPVSAMLCIGLGGILELYVPRTIGRRRFLWLGFGTLLALAIVVNIASVWVGFDQYWRELHEIGTASRPASEEVVRQRTHDSYNSIHGSPLYRNVAELDDANPVAASHFRGGPDAIAIVGGLLSLTSLGVAWSLARAEDEEERGVLSRTGERSGSPSPSAV